MSKIKNMKLRYKIGVGVASTAAVVAAGGAAFAYFTSNGSNTGTASVGSTNKSWTVSVTPDSTDSLLPGSGTATLPFSLTNATSGHLGLLGVTVAVKSSSTTGDILKSDGTDVTGCLASWFNVDGTGNPSDTSASSEQLTYNSNPVAFTQDVAGSGVVSGTATLALTNSTSTSQDACQGAVPVIVVSTSSTTGS